MWQGLRLGGRVVHHLMRRYVLMEFQWLKCLWVVLCPFGYLFGVDSANHDCLPQFLNYFTRKTCQGSWVASFEFSGGLVVLFLWLKVALGIFFNQPITLAVASANRHCSALLLLRKGTCWGLIELPHYQGRGLIRFWFGASGGQVCDLVQKSRSASQFFAS